MKKTHALTLSAVLSALSVALLLFGSVVEVLDLCAVMLASLCTLFALIRIDGKHAWLVYAVTALLSLLLLPSKVVALEYVLFGGYYPILRWAVARFRPIPAYGIKLVSFNGALTVLLLLFREIFIAGEVPVSLEVATYALANVSFLLYDYVLGRVGFMIVHRLRPRFGHRK